MARVKQCYVNGDLYAYYFTCPGCEEVHLLPVVGPLSWAFNGDVANPSFSPSINQQPAEHTRADGSARKMPRCHSFVTNGLIEFLPDSDHALAGLLVVLPEMDP